MSRRSISGATRPSNPARASAPRRPAGALIAGALVALGVMALAPDAQAWSESKKGERMREVESAWPHAYWGPDISATAIFGCVAEVFGVPTGCSAGLKQTVTEVGQQASVDLLGLLRDAANHQVDLATLDAKIGYIEFEHRECTDNPLSHGPFGIGPRTVCTPWGLDPNVKAYFVWRIKVSPPVRKGATRLRATGPSWALLGCMIRSGSRPHRAQREGPARSAPTRVVSGRRSKVEAAPRAHDDGAARPAATGRGGGG
jgi:hypothetical protein